MAGKTTMIDNARASLFRLATLLLPLAVTSGCGFGSAGVAAALGKGGRKVTRAPTDLTLLTPVDGQSGLVTLQVGLSVDPAEDLDVVSIDYSLGEDLVAYRGATPALGFPNELVAGQTVDGATLATRASRFLTFVWNAHYDLDRLRTGTAGTIARPVTARATLRVTVRNRTTGEVLTRSTDEYYLDQALMATVAGGGVGDGTSPTLATMLDPVGIATGGGSEIYVADSGNHRVRKITFEAAVASRIETLIGNGFEGDEAGARAARLSSMRAPRMITTDAFGNVFFAQGGATEASQLSAYEKKSGLLFDLLGGFGKVSGLFMSPSRQLFIADETAGMVWRLDLLGVDPFLDPLPGLVSVGSFDMPAAVAAVEAPGLTTVYIAKGMDHTVVRVLGAAAPEVVAGGGTDAPAIGRNARSVSLQTPVALTATATHLFVADQGGNLVLALDALTGEIVNVLTQVVDDAGGAPRAMFKPTGIALDAAGNLFVVETGGGMVPGSSGHQVLLATAPTQPGVTRVRLLAAGGSLKRVTQDVAEVRSALNGVIIERTPSTG